MRLAFEARDAGVYLVQVEGSDRIGRRQQVSVDFFRLFGAPIVQGRTFSPDEDCRAAI